jgi:hypothetical protein
MIATSHLTEQQFQQYKNRKIPLYELFAIGDHLAECKECREKLGCTEERAAILEALRRDLESAMVKGSQDLPSKELALYTDPPPGLQAYSQEAQVTVPSEKRSLPILPLVIGMGTILLMFGLLITLWLTNLL